MDRCYSLDNTSMGNLKAYKQPELKQRADYPPKELRANNLPLHSGRYLGKVNTAYRQSDEGQSHCFITHDNIHLEVSLQVA